MPTSGVLADATSGVLCLELIWDWCECSCAMLVVQQLTECLGAQPALGSCCDLVDLSLNMVLSDTGGLQMSSCRALALLAANPLCSAMDGPTARWRNESVGARLRSATCTAHRMCGCTVLFECCATLLRASVLRVLLTAFVYTWVYVYVYAFVYVCVHAFVYTCVYTCVYAFVYVCVYAWVSRKDIHEELLGVGH